MTNATSSAVTPTAQPGGIVGLLLRWMMRPARVAAVEVLSPHFRLIDLEGDALKGVAWAPGQKVQVAMGTGMTARTYTPMRWDTVAGSTRLLAFSHGDGPGARWATSLRAGDACQFLGPRRSLDLADLGGTVLFGDETSFALAAALGDSRGGQRPTCVFEVTDVAEATAVLQVLGIADVRLVERQVGDGHLTAAATATSETTTNGAPIVLTGKASSIQHIQRHLKASEVSPARMRTKAYWATGKKGLD